jgi:hypothetical protein
MPSLSPRYWNPQQVTGAAFNPSNSGQGGDGNWDTTSVLWSTNGDGTGGTAWSNSTDLSADIGTATLTLQTDITTGDIVSSNITLTGSYTLNIGYSVSNVTMVANIPVTSSADTVYGFQALVNNNLTFKKGFYCNGFTLDNPVIISGTFDATSSAITNYIRDSLTLNANSTIAGPTTIQLGGTLLVTSNNTASFNNTFSSDNTVTSNGLTNFNNTFSLDADMTFNGSGRTNINSNLGGNYNIIKSGSGILFLSGSRTNFSTKNINIDEGKFILNSNVNLFNNDIICSGTLNCLGNAIINGNITFATGTLRLGI